VGSVPVVSFVRLVVAIAGCGGSLDAGRNSPHDADTYDVSDAGGAETLDANVLHDASAYDVSAATSSSLLEF